VSDSEPKNDPESPSAAGSAEGAAPPAKLDDAGPGAPEAEGDKFRPEAIAARIDAIGEETEADRVAHAEEQKLLERRQEQRKKGGKKGLESAASKRLAKIGEGTVKRPGGSLAGAVNPEAEPFVERAVDLQRWIGENRQLFGGVVAVAVLGAAGFIGWSYWQDKRNADASAMLAKAFADEHGHVSDKDPDDDEETLTKELYPTFKTSAERRDAAIAQCKTVEAKYPGTGAAILARLSEASLLLDAGDAKGALAAYDDVKASPLGKADVEVRGRATEGLGFAEELLAQGEGADRAKHLEAALAAFHDLAQIDVQGLKELGLYHQARVLVANGDKAKAIELLKEAHKLVSDPGETHAFPYLEFVVEDRLRELDPSALPPKALKFPGMGGGGPGAGAAGAVGPSGMPNTDDPRIQELLRQMSEKHKGGGGPVPAPSAP
jgi:hypothetical protein